MRNLKNYKLFSLMLVLVYVLSACSGVPGSGGANVNDSDPVVTFAGVVESMGAGQWTISGQVVNVSGTTSVDANIAVGDTVKVEAVIDQGGVPTAVKIEFSGADDVNSNDDNGNDDNANDDNSNGDNSNDDNGNDDNTNGNTNGNDNSSGDDIEVIGMLEALTSASLTIDGVEYQIDSLTEFKGEIVVGDQVKAHVIVNADGTLTVREIEKFSGDDNGNDDNSNDDNGNDDNGNDDNGNDDNGNDDNGNDDNGNDDNGNDDNGNDDDSNDDNSNDDDSNDDNSNG